MPRLIEWVYDVDPTNQGFFWPASKQKRQDYFALKLLRPAETEAVYQCRPGGKTGSIFVEGDFRYFDAPFGMELGRANPAVHAWVEKMGGLIAQGWDTAMSANSTADHTVCVTVLLMPCNVYHRDDQTEALLGPCEQHFDVYVIDVYRDKLDIGDLVSAIRTQHIKWQSNKVCIEKKQSGISAMQALANTGVPMEGMAAQENKRDRAITGGAGAGSVQGWFKMGRVLFPSDAPWLPAFIRELKDFTGEKGGTDDQVDAMVHVVSWAIREGTSGALFPSGWDTPEAVDAKMQEPEGMARLFYGLDPGFETQEDPFSSNCGRCVNWEKGFCKLHKRATPSISAACEFFDNGSSFISIPRF